MAVKPEMIGDIEEGEPVPGATDELGLTPEDRAVWDEMQSSGKETLPDAEPEALAEAEPALAAKPEEVAPAEGEDDAEDDVAEAAPDPKTGKPPQKQVSWQKHQRLLAARDARLKTAEEKANTEALNNAKLAERLAILNEALNAPAPVDPAVAQQQAVAANPMLEPDIKVEDDALGAIAQLQRRHAYLLQQQTSTHEETKATLEDRQLKDDFQRDAEMYGRTEEGKHFGPAYQFLKDSRLTELAISLFDKDPTDPQQVFTQDQINRLVADFNAEEKWVVSNARKAGKSPSAAIMKLAKGRGFKPAAAAPAPAGGAPAAAPVRAAPLAPPSAVAKIQAEAEGAAASRSLSDGGGAPPALEMTPDRLLKMNDDEFGAYIDNLPKGRLDAIMGKQVERRA